MSINALAAGFAAKLTDDQTAGTFYDAVGGRIFEAVIPDQVADLPACRWIVVTSPQQNRLSGAAIDAELQVDIYGTTQAGSASLATAADLLVALLERQPLTIAGYNGAQALPIDLGGVVADPADGVLSITQRWRVVANT